MKSLATKSLQEILKQIIQLLFSKYGLGVIILSLCATFYEQVKILLTLQYTLPILLLISTFVGILVYRITKRKYKPKYEEPVVVDKLIVETSAHEWRTVLYSDGNIDVGYLPFCTKHDKIFIDLGIYHGCPTADYTCDSVSNLQQARDQAISIAESEYRKRNVKQKYITTLYTKRK